MTMLFTAILASSLFLTAHATPQLPTKTLFQSNFKLPASGNALWYRSPSANWVFESLPIGNGYMGAAVFGGVQNDTVLMNLDDLWAGGPFSSPTYNGANWNASYAPTVHEKLKALRNTIFANGTAPDLNGITTDAGDYGTFSSAGNLVIARGVGIDYSNYTRWLDMDQGIIRSTWKETKNDVRREYICSYPERLCSHMTSSITPFPQVSYAIETIQGHSNLQLGCQDNSTLVLRGNAGSNGAGMLYEIVGRVQVSKTTGASTTCSAGVITVSNATDIWFTWTGGTEYNIDAGTADQRYSFKGPDPHSSILKRLSSASSLSYSSFVQRHVKDYTTGTSQNFQLDIGQKPDWSRTTDQLIEDYKEQQLSGQRGDTGRTLLEWLFFNFGRHLMFGSARGNLPANLQGVWSQGSWAPWSGDYHVNINVQMMYWPVETTGMDVTQTLWDFIQKTVIPRGSETASILYNVSRGWAMHNEINTFGSTGMKGLDIPNYNPAEWTNYAAGGAWLMTHAWDHFDYTGDVQWLRKQGYPLLKSTAEYWLDALQLDRNTNDGSLVAVPCNSPELPQTTFGCAHWQQLIWELFNSVEKALQILGTGGEQSFLLEVQKKRVKLDRGLRIGAESQVQEWKLDFDNSAHLDHRHLSHLTGLYPSYSIASFVPGSDGIKPGGLTRQALLTASTTTLIQRGIGTAPDADAGWGKIWRAACWAQLGNSTRFYDQLSYAISRNFAANLFSLYNPFNTAENTLFQMDANGGFPAAVLNALIQAPDTQYLSETLTITLLPALPTSWSQGALRGVRVRRGLEVDMAWKAGSLTAVTLKAPRLQGGKQIKVIVKGKNLNKELLVGRGNVIKVL
ncbi:hypothetical protein FRC19_006480 [Serendipita sp. 401]|nr:hypothetical protein FRC19_006480 [Serendipita sp. 401]